MDKPPFELAPHFDEQNGCSPKFLSPKWGYPNILKLATSICLVGQTNWWHKNLSSAVGLLPGNFLRICYKMNNSVQTVSILSGRFQYCQDGFNTVLWDQKILQIPHRNPLKKVLFQKMRWKRMKEYSFDPSTQKEIVEDCAGMILRPQLTFLHL